jgi:hypothetical protein
MGLLLPEFVRDDVEKGVYDYSQGLEDVSILFCDVCDFDSILASEQA